MSLMFLCVSSCSSRSVVVEAAIYGVYVSLSFGMLVVVMVVVVAAAVVVVMVMVGS